MGFLSSHFNFTSSSGQFHSSGMAKGDSVTGSASTRSFEQRQRVEKNRRVIGAYKNAAITRAYRDSALSPSGSDISHRFGGQYSDENQAVRNAHSSRIDANEQSTSMIRQRHTSRIDVVKNTRQGFNAGQIAPEPPRQGVARFGIAKPTFSEPQSRGYNPYQ